MTFVKHDSIVRRIWGDSDVVLFIFAGSAAEFALNKAVDWLYFTGKLPADPLGRLFSTVAYAHRIIFADEADALQAIDNITAIHQAVEHSRQARIPDWAYRDVLYMLIEYSISAYELLERTLTATEKEEVYDVFYRMGMRMHIPSLPATYAAWTEDRCTHMKQDLAYNQYTPDLFLQYKKHLGPIRYNLMLQVQSLITPPHVRRCLKLKTITGMELLIKLYSSTRRNALLQWLRGMLLPAAYKEQIQALNKKAD